MSTRALSALLLTALAAGCGHHEEAHDGHAEAATYTCPPCGMEMAADAELVELGGMRFAVCNDACRDEVAADPAKYAEHAVP